MDGNGNGELVGWRIVTSRVQRDRFTYAARSLGLNRRSLIRIILADFLKNPSRSLDFSYSIRPLSDDD